MSTSEIKVTIKAKDAATAPLLTLLLIGLRLRYGGLRFFRPLWWKTKYKLIKFRGD